MSRFVPKIVLSAMSRLALGMALALALLAGLLPAVTGVPTARAEPPASAVPVVGAKVEEAKDAKGVVQLWVNGGPVTKAAAKAALLGDEPQLKEFIASGQYTAMQQDSRTAAIQLTLVGRSNTRTAAEKALATGDWKSLQNFLSDGWKQAWLQDDWQATSYATTYGTPTVKRAAQKAYDAGDAAVQTFVVKGRADAEFIDKQKQVSALLKGSPSVKAAANAALDVDTVQAFDDFLRYGQFVAAARDAETATVTQLADQAKSASLQAVELNKSAQTAAEQAAQAAKLAKEAAQRAAAEAAAAKDSAAKAGAAAMRAASLADQAARAAQVAVTAAQDARSALNQAANAATNAAAAAARAEQAAAGAQSSAAAAAGDAQQAAAARLAAQSARDAAAGARKAADAAGFAAQSTDASTNAANAAKSAGRNAADAAAAAAAAASESGVSDAEAAQARAAAARANAAANRAEQASAQVDSLAGQAAATARVAQTAALEAAQHAENAASNADEAARQAGNAATAADQARKYADAARLAAKASAAAATKAAEVRDLARKADDERLAAELEFKLAQARDDQALEDSKRKAKTDAEKQASEAAATSKDLIAKLTAPGANLDAQIKEVKAAIVGVAESGAAWQKAGAQLAIAGTPQLMKEFIVSGLTTAREQDEWDQAMVDANSGSRAVQLAAQDALFSGEEDVTQFLAVGKWDLLMGGMAQQTSLFLKTGGAEVQKAAKAALDANTSDAFRNFLNNVQPAAAAIDNRKRVSAMLSAAPPEAKELRAAARVALEGPDSYIREFLVSGQVEATKRDQETASHVAAIEGLIKRANSDAATAQAAYSSAEAAAARAKQSWADADRFAADARNSANEAKASADQAANFASQAQDSADQAARSAETARSAAAQARSDAQAAGAEAAKAANSAAAARISASIAAASSAAAQQSAEAAGKDAELAAQAAREALDIASTKKREEDEAANLAKANTGTQSGEESQVEQEIALAEGGDAAAQELKDARAALAEGDVMQMIIREGGQLLLDFFGVNDVINCVTKGDFGACAMALVGVLPWGKMFKAVEAIGMLTKIVPKVVNFFERIQKANKVVEKYAGKVRDALIRKPTPPNPPVGATWNPAAMGSKNSNALGNYGEAAGIPNGLPRQRYTINGNDRISDGLDSAGNIWEAKNAAKLGGNRNYNQLRDAIEQASLNKEGAKLILVRRCNEVINGTLVLAATKFSKKIDGLIESAKLAGQIELKCIPLSMP